LPRGAAYVNNPVSFDPRATPEFFTNVTDARFRDEGKNEVIDVDRLKTGQALVNSERLVNIVRSGSVVHSTSYVRDPSWRSQPNELAVVKHGNDYFIWNGNHRAAAAMLMGQKRVAVRVLEA